MFLSPVSTYPPASSARFCARPTVRFGREAEPPSQADSPDESPEDNPSPYKERLAGMELGQRLKVGAASALCVFLPPQLTNTLRNVAIYTTIASVISAIPTGPFALALVPVFMGIGLTWEVLSAFLHGVLRKPEHVPEVD